MHPRNLRFGDKGFKPACFSIRKERIIWSFRLPPLAGTVSSWQENQAPPLPKEGPGGFEAPPSPKEGPGRFEAPPSPKEGPGGFEAPPSPKEGPGGFEAPPFLKRGRGDLKLPPFIKGGRGDFSAEAYTVGAASRAGGRAVEILPVPPASRDVEILAGGPGSQAPGRKRILSGRKASAAGARRTVRSPAIF